MNVHRFSRSGSVSQGLRGLGRTYGPRYVATPPNHDRKPARRLVVFSNPERLAVDCWCRAEVVSVPQADVMACLTASCGRPECQPPEVEACASSAT